MSLFKKFTDCCGATAAFMGCLLFIQKYMAFKPKTDEEYIDWISKSTDYAPEYVETVTKAPSKISQFFTPELIKDVDYRPIAILTALLVISVLVSILVRRLPYVCFTVSIFPATVAMYLFCKGTLFNQPALYLILPLIHVLGNAVECITRDRKDGRHRVWLCAKISMLIPSLTCLVLAVSFIQSRFLLPDGISSRSAAKLLSLT